MSPIGTIAWLLAGCCALGACVSSFLLIWSHLQQYVNPDLQRHVVRILWMVPVYASHSWLSLTLPKYAIYFDTTRDCYESYVLYEFFTLLVALLGGKARVLELLEHKPPVQLPLVRVHVIAGAPLFRWCSLGILQFVFARPLLAVLVLSLAVHGRFDPSDLSWRSVALYVWLLNNLSVSLALYCLYLFYELTREDLAAWSPAAKFLCVKAVIFFSYWQGVLLLALEHAGRVGRAQGAALQHALICGEMLLVALVHPRVFGPAQFAEPRPDPLPLLLLPSLAITESTAVTGPPPTPAPFGSVAASASASASASGSSPAVPLLKTVGDVVNVSDVVEATVDSLRPVQRPHSKLT